MTTARTGEVQRVDPGVAGLELVMNGGLPRDRLSLVSGTAGAGKTMLAVQFLAAGAESGDEPGVFVSFEERPEALRQNFRSFGWDVEAWEQAGTWLFVDGSPQLDEETPVLGDYDLSPLVVRVRHAEYWDVDEAKITQLFKMAKAVVSGEPPRSLGEHKELAMP